MKCFVQSGVESAGLQMLYYCNHIIEISLETDSSFVATGNTSD